MLNFSCKIYKKDYFEIFLCHLKSLWSFLLQKKFILAIYLSVWKLGRYYRYAVFRIIRIEIYRSMI